MNDRAGRWALRVLGGTAAYIACAQVSFALDLAHGSVSTVWVPTGFAFVLLLIGGRSLWPAILLGEFLANVMHASGTGPSLIAAVGDVLEALAGREILVRLDFRPELNRVRDVLALLIPAALLPTMIGALFGTTELLLSGGVPWSAAWQTGYTWWLADATGVIVVSPLLLAFWTRGLSMPSSWRAAEGAAFVLTLGPIAWIAAGHSAEVALLALPVLIWGALRFGQRGAVLANAVVAGAAVALVSHDSAMPDTSVVNRLLMSQDFVAVAALTTLVLAAVMTQRDGDARKLQASSLAALALVEEQAELSRVATAVASETPLAELFATVTASAGRLLGAQRAAIVRDDGLGLTTNLARWSRTGDHGPAGEVGTGGLGAPITVHGLSWGRLWIDSAGPHPAAALSSVPGQGDPVAMALDHYAGLLALAIANTEARQNLVDLASTDPLTGLANHRTFHERLAEEMVRCRRYDRPIAVAMIDIDNFKDINDVFGHRAGDEVLATVATRVASVMRSEAVVARVGGDELAMLIPECDAETAAAAIERARAMVSAEPILHNARVTLSAGICDSAHADHPERLLELADSALYSAKAAGRDACLTYASLVS